MLTRKLTLDEFERRIVPAATVKFTEVDGDKVTVQTNKGTTAQLQQALGLTSGATNVNSIFLNLIGSGLAPVFAGTNVTITAGGDGNKLADRVTINAFDSSGANNIDLGSISVKGNLTYIDAGDNDLLTPAIKKITVTNWGPTSSGAGATSSQIRGNIGAIVVKGAFNGYLYSNAANGAANFQTSQGTVIGSFQAKFFAQNSGSYHGYLQVRGINKLKITNTMFGPGAQGTTNNGKIDVVFLNKTSVNSMTLGADIDLFPAL